jgi:hypothetical protein
MKTLLSLLAISCLFLSSCNNNPPVSISYYAPGNYYHVTDSLENIQFSQYTWCKVPHPENAEISYSLDVDQNGTAETKLILRNNYFGSQMPCESYTQYWSFEATDTSQSRSIEFATLADIPFPILQKVSGVDTLQQVGFTWSASGQLKNFHPQNNFLAQMPDLDNPLHIGFRVRSSNTAGWKYGWMLIEPDDIGFKVVGIAFNNTPGQAIIVGQH